ncbi:MAG: M16 family metallopeptidase [Candidatus Binatia bacterium]
MTPEISTLANGLRVVTTVVPLSEAAVTRLTIGVGARHETRETNGASHFLEHILFKGTEQRPSETAIAAAIESLGGSLNAATGREITYYWNRLPCDHVTTGIEVVADQIRGSRFESGAIDREKKVVGQEMRRRHDQPGSWAARLAGRGLFGDHPLGWDILGTSESLAGLDGDRLRGHVASWYVPGNMVLSVAGRIDPHEVVAAAERWFGDMEPREVDAAVPSPTAQPAERVVVDERPLEQASLVLAMPGIAHRDPDRYAEVILDDVLGGGMSARLFREVREKRGLCYSVSSDFDRMADAGTFSVASGVARERLLETIEVVLDMLDDLARNPVPEDELARSREHAVGGFRLAWETSASLAARASQLLTLGEIEPIDDVAARLRAVTADDVLRVARRLFRRERVIATVVGPFDDDGAIRGLLGTGETP